MIIETNRLILRFPKPGESEEILNFYIKNSKHLAPWFPKTPNAFYTLEYWDQKIKDYIREYESSESLRLHIYFSENESLIGMVNFTNFERDPFQNCRVGYSIGIDYEGKGLMYEALKAGCNYIFNKLNFHRIEANYIPSNKRSGNLLGKIGFVEHGISRSYIKIGGYWQDHILTSLTNEHFKEL